MSYYSLNVRVECQFASNALTANYERPVDAPIQRDELVSVGYRNYIGVGLGSVSKAGSP